ncbi:MAG TPA: ascorbate-dependent monooxygenase [Methylomirabilota bacterium]|nr:ascorbate-dependent monooxygenase [Methylomirabilota bacterium]
MLSRLLLICAVLVAGDVAAADDAPPVTFSQHVAPLLQQHCQECHRPGGGAPFTLDAYGHVYRRRHKILESVEKRRMPPWKAVAGYGDLAGERRMSDAEIATLARWVAAGAPEGDARDLPPPRAFAAASAVDAADLVLRPDQAFTVAGRGGDVYRCFSIPTSFPEDRYFTTAVVVPGNSKIVHHMLAMVDPTGVSAGRTTDGVGRDGERGYPCFGGPGFRIDGYLGGWAPGARPWELPDGVGMLLPKGARVVFQLHYHNAQLSPQTDLTELRLKAATGPVRKRLHFMRVGRFNLSIPAGNPRYEIEAGSFVHRRMQLIAIHPHMHMLGREMKVWARMKDESITPLIHIADWDFNWQGFYWFRTPVTLPVASWIELTAAWDNSAENPRNPNKPPRDVSWGERTVDEMGHAAILYTVDAEQPK